MAKDSKKADAKAKAADKLKQAKAKERAKAAEKLKAMKDRAKTAEKELKSMSRTRAKEAEKLKAAKDRAKAAEKDLKSLSKTRAKEAKKLQQDPTAGQDKPVIEQEGTPSRSRTTSGRQADKLAATRSANVEDTATAAVAAVRPTKADADLGTSAESSTKTDEDGQRYAEPVSGSQTGTKRPARTPRTPRTPATRKPTATRTPRTPSDGTSPSRTDLLRQAGEKGIVGRHRMSREQLERALSSSNDTAGASAGAPTA